jgi:hypothetical protein
MNPGTTCSDFIVIVILYAVIGLMAAAGAIFMARKILAPMAEQIFYAMLVKFQQRYQNRLGISGSWRRFYAWLFSVDGCGGAGHRAADIVRAVLLGRAVSVGFGEDSAMTPMKPSPRPCACSANMNGATSLLPPALWCASHSPQSNIVCRYGIFTTGSKPPAKVRPR